MEEKTLKPKRRPLGFKCNKDKNQDNINNQYRKRISEVIKAVLNEDR